MIERNLTAIAMACALGLSTAACSGAPSAGDTAVVDANGSATMTANAMTPAPGDSATPRATAAPYLGRWIGVEGMYLTVADKPGGGVTLDMQWDLDNKGVFDGTITPEGIAFMRNGKTLVLKPSDGAATGLKYLADKTTCLTVAAGEGYCRA